MRSVLVVVTRQIGDVLLTTPLIRQVHALWPGVAVDVLGFEGTLGMLRGNPDVRALIATPARLGVGGGLRLARRLWRRYDLALVAQPSDRAHLIGFLASPLRSGIVPRHSSSNWWKHLLARHLVVSDGDLGEEHVVSERLRLLTPWQPAGASTGTPEVVGPASAELPDDLRRQLQPGYLVIHTPSMWSYKAWPPDHFRALIGRLTAQGRQVVLTGGPGAADRACVAAMRGAGPDALVVDAGILDFNQVAALLRSAALYIGPDTSVSHLAAACGTRVLAIFGPTNPQRWAPWPGGPRVQVVHFERRSAAQTVGGVTLMQAEHFDCVPCGRAGCEDHHHSPTRCLPAITPERVAQEALRLLNGEPAPTV